MGSGRLLVCYRAPINRLNGDALRLWHLLEAGNADVIAFRADDNDRVRGRIVDPLPWRSLEVIDGPMGDWAGVVNAQVADRRPEHVVVHLSGALHQVDWIRDIAAPFNLNASDSYSLAYRRRFESLAKLRHPVAAAGALMRSRQWLAAERFIAVRAARCLVTSSADRAAFAGGPANVVAVGNGTDWTLAPPFYQVREPGKVIGFHGNLLWRPNMSGISYVCRHVLPLVRREIPDAEFHVAGGPLLPQTRPLAALPGVKFHGYVDDLRPMLSAVDVYAAPMVEGSGVKNKLLEAMAAGIPIVVNPRGAEGLDPGGRALVEVGENPAAMAASIVALLRDPARRAATSAAVRAHAVAHYGWESFARQYLENLAPAVPR